MDSLEKIEYVLLALTLLSFVLHFIAPRTRTKADDLAAEAVDAVKDTVAKKKSNAVANKLAK